MPKVTGYYYPWDILGADFNGRGLSACGVERIALAASYHSVRAATPKHPTRRIVDAHEAALYVPVVDDDWPIGAMKPRDAAEWTGSNASFNAAAEVIRASGLAIDAWIVLNHSSRLGRMHPAVCVTNAFGERYAYALCPSNSTVQDYSVRVVEQVIRQGKPNGIILEAVGPLGYGHQNQHEKTDGADFSPATQKLLSLCFCQGCQTLYMDAGIDVEDARQLVRNSIVVQQGLDASASIVENELLERMLSIRWQTCGRLVERITEAARAGGIERIVLNTTSDTWATGPFLSSGALAHVSQPPQTHLLPCWGDGAASLADLHALRAGMSVGSRFAAYVLALPPKLDSAKALVDEWSALIEGGFDELHVYHLGLASKRRQLAIMSALRTVVSAR